MDPGFRRDDGPAGIRMYLIRTASGSAARIERVLMEQLLIAVSDDILGLSLKSGGLFAAVAVVQMLIIYLFIRLSRTMNTLAGTVSALAGQVGHLATQNDLKNLDEKIKAAKEKQKSVNEILHDRCTGLVARVSKLEGICETYRSKK